MIEVRVGDTLFHADTVDVVFVESFDDCDALVVVLAVTYLDISGRRVKFKSSSTEEVSDIRNFELEIGSD